ncbi:MAG TPA: alpha/beta hydrolase [Pyrinomonadaceae bacterium]|nr:alpha/beta hydrolase [Pyrinomonadaceae bacterium]
MIKLKHLSIKLIFAFVLLFLCLFSQNQILADTALINNTKLYYEIAGKGETVVLIHGGLADSRLWDAQFAEFAKYFRVIRYDLRGYGKSEFPNGEFSHIEDLYGLLKFLKVKKASLVGLSIGGVIAADFTIEHPEMVDKLILSSSGLRGDTTPADQKTIEVYKAVQAQAKEKAIDLWLENPLFSTIKDNPQNEQKTRQMLADNYKYWAAIEKPIPVKWAKQQTIERLSEIKKPTLIIVGDKDAPNILAIAETLNKKINGSQKKIITNVSHHLNLEKPKEYNQIVIDFLKKKK